MAIDWLDEEDQLYALLLPLVLDAAQDGALLGMELLPDGGGSIDNDWLFLSIARWADEYTRNLARQITGTSRSRFEALIAGGVTGQELIDKLASIFGMDRAEMIGITTVTDAYGESNMTAWVLAGSTLHRWNTQRDGNVCPICLENEGAVVPIGFPFPSGHERPSAHARDRCWLTPIVSEALGIGVQSGR